MTPAPHVSVIIPAYNGAAYLRPALESVLAQEGGDFETVLIDDDSTDETADIARSFAGVRYVRNPRNLGLAANFNRCLEEVRAPYMALFCQDDLMAPGNLARKSGVLDQHPRVGLVASNALFFNDSNPSEGRIWNSDLPGERIYPGSLFFQRLVLGDNPIALSGALFRTELARRLGGFDLRFPQALDWHFWMRIALASDVAYLAAPLVRYRDHPGTATRSHEAFRNIRDVFSAKTDVLRRTGRPVPGREVLEDQFRTHFGKGVLASSLRACFRKDWRLARSLLGLSWEVAPNPCFLPKAILLGLIQGLLGIRVYPSRERSDIGGPRLAWKVSGL